MDEPAQQWGTVVKVEKKETLKRAMEVQAKSVKPARIRR